MRWALDRLADPVDAAAREAGARWLRGLGEASHAALREAATGPGPWRLRAGALDVLRETGGSVPPEAMAQLLADENRAIRSAALRLVDRFETEFEPALRDRFHDVRREALRALARSARRGNPPDVETVLPFVEELLADPEASVRSEAREALLEVSRASPAAAFPDRIDRLFDPSKPQQCEGTLRSLASGETVLPSAAPRLLSLARESQLSEDSRFAAGALAALAGSDDAALPPLATRGFLSSRQSWVSDLCLRAIRVAGIRWVDPLLEAAAGDTVDPPRFALALELCVALDPERATRRLLGLLDRLELRDAARRAPVWRSFPREVEPDLLLELAQRPPREEEASARAAAAETLARASAPSLHLALFRLAQDADASVRHAAVFALARAGGDLWAGFVAKSLREERDPELRAEFAEALSRWVRAESLRSALLEALAGDDESVRSAAIGGLSRFRSDPVVVAGLREAFRREAFPVERGGPADLGPARRRRERAVAAAAQIGGPEATRFLEEVASALRESPDEEATAVLAVTRLAQRPEAEPFLAELLSGRASSAVQFECAIALAPRARAEAIRFLVDAFTTLDPAARRRALEALSASPGAVGFLLAVASDPSENASVREGAVERLGRLADRAEVQAALASLAREENVRSVRAAAIRALGESPDEASKETLRSLVADFARRPEDPAERELRVEATFALARVDGPEAAEALSALAFERPLATWREASAFPASRLRPNPARLYEAEGEALDRLAALGEAGAQAAAERVARFRDAGKLFLLDPAFLGLAGERLSSVDVDAGLDLLGIASRTAAGGDRFALRLRLAEVALARGELSLAAQALEAALRNIEEGEVSSGEAQVLLGAPASFEEFSPRRRLAVEADLARGLAAFEGGDAAAGESAFARALDRAGSDPGAMRRVALRCMERPDLLGLATRIARRASQLAPGDRRAREALGWALLRSGDARAALEAFEAALALPDAGGRGEGPALFGAAAARLALGEEAEAIEALREAIGKDAELREAAQRSPFFEALRDRLPEIEPRAQR